MEQTLKQKGEQHNAKHQCQAKTSSVVRNFLDVIEKTRGQQYKVYKSCELFETILFRQCGLTLLYRYENYRKVVTAKLEEFAKDPEWGHNFEGYLQIMRRINKKISLEMPSK